MNCYPPEIKAMMDNTDTCLCCGVKLRYLPDKEKRRNRGYCSLDCYYKLPPRLAYLEQTSGKSARVALLELLNTGDTFEYVAAQLLCWREQLFIYLKHLGIRRQVRYV